MTAEPMAAIPPAPAAKQDVHLDACHLPPERKREVWANRIVPEIAAPV